LAKPIIANNFRRCAFLPEATETKDPLLENAGTIIAPARQ
jgi:hypothetical protein